MPKTKSRKPPAAPAKTNEPDLVLVRATINLPKLPCGQEAHVDPTVPYIRQALRAGFLVPVVPGRGGGR